MKPGARVDRARYPAPARGARYRPESNDNMRPKKIRNEEYDEKV